MNYDSAKYPYLTEDDRILLTIMASVEPGQIPPPADFPLWAYQDEELMEKVMRMKRLTDDLKAEGLSYHVPAGVGFLIFLDIMKRLNQANGTRFVYQ